MKTLLNNYSNIFRAVIATILSSLTFIEVSCDSFVEADKPEAQLPSSEVFESYATASAALADVYSKIRDKGMLTGQSSGISNTLGNYTDELNFYGLPNASASSFYINALVPGNNVIQDYWNSAYNQIYSANSIIERTLGSTNLTDEQKKQLSGEAFFVRALLHFYLVNLFGDIPYIITTDYKINAKVSKISKREIYNLILQDLNKSIELLSSEYIRAERIRPNKYVALALQARVFLYDEKWAEASNASSAVLNASSLYTLQNDLKSVFLKESKETLWQLQSSVAGKNTSEATTFIFFTVPPSSSALSTELINSFHTGDLRKDNWTGSASNGTLTWYYPFKYKEFYSTSVSKEYSVVFRLAEQYLIRAESRARQGDLIGAKEDIDKIRYRAGLNKTTAISASQLIDAVIEERKWELFTEYGHRFFDLKRCIILDKVLSPIKAGWNTTDKLFPLPQNEINLNPNILPQNEGY